VRESARRVRLLLLDVDGVLTDGRIFFVPHPGGGLVESKAFDVADGTGIVLARRAGLPAGVISGRRSPVVTERATELGMEEIHLGVADKVQTLDEILVRRAIPAEHVAFVGDEVVDLGVMRRVGFPVAVGSASRDVTGQALYVTAARGGRGAVREVIELILRSQGKWEPLIREFLA